MSEEDFTFNTRQTSQEILDKKDIILKMLDDENYYNENGDLNIGYRPTKGIFLLTIFKYSLSLIFLLFFKKYLNSK